MFWFQYVLSIKSHEKGIKNKALVCVFGFIKFIEHIYISIQFLLYNNVLVKNKIAHITSNRFGLETQIPQKEIKDEKKFPEDGQI